MASAAVEMLTLGHCRKMLVYDTDLGLDSDTDMELVNAIDGAEGKRIVSETEDDQDRGHVKKRRKQSKPVRIASSESLSDGEKYTENGMTKNDKTGADIISIFKNSLNDHAHLMSSNSSDEDYKVKREGDMEDCYHRTCNDTSLPINLSNAKYSPKTNGTLTECTGAQTVDAEQEHELSLEKTRLGNDPTGPSRFDREPTFTSPSSPQSFPSVKPPQPGHSVRHSGSPIRIFNPEAFCDLCNKEFCNKYFLKTHKANKHGIYSENIGPNLIDALPSLPFINYFSGVAEALPSNSHLSRSVLRKPQPAVTLPQHNSVFLNKSLAANGNTRAFCNICQREFCNKYFVRRHKAKIHGIIDTSFPDTPPSEQEQKMHGLNDGKPCVGNDVKCQDDDMCFTFSDRQMATGYVLAPSDDERSERRPPEPVTDSVIQVAQNKDVDSESRSSPGVSRTFSPVQSIPTLSDEMCRQMDSAEKAKRMAITNSEAFCDICCKEYCNKYFLRTHKMRSHGIITPDWDKRDDKPNVYEGGLPHGIDRSIQMPMPLNLIVGDHGPSVKIDDGDDNAIPSTIDGDIFCNVCGQKFKDIFLLKMHVSYAHPKEGHDKHVSNGFGDSVSSKGKPEPNNDSEEKCYGVELQASSMLRCDICRKSFSAASLETHIENEHGHLLDEVGTFAEENSDSQMFQREAKYDCGSCQRRFTSASRLNQHIIESHGSAGERMPIEEFGNSKTTKETEELTKQNRFQAALNATEIQTTPTSSFCEICKKELCNKYFMKTHMQRMHGISIDNGAHIGGVVCDVCNKELCSKYFLRVHKQNSHGIADEILGLDVSRNHSPVTDSSLRPAEQSDLNNRYFSHFTEVCPVCSRRFRSMKWLKAHLLNDHGEDGKDRWKDLQSYYESRQQDRHSVEIQKKSDAMSQASVEPVRNFNEGYQQKLDSTGQRLEGYQENLNNSVFTTIFNGKASDTKQYNCSYCPFTTSILAFLFVHERSHINNAASFTEQKKRHRCSICSLTFETEEMYEKHSVSHALSDINGRTSNGLGVSRNDHVKPEINRIEDATDLRNTLSYPFKANVNFLKRNDTKPEDEEEAGNHEIKIHNGTRHVESYDGAFSEDSRKDLSEGKYRSEEDDRFDEALIRVKESLESIANKADIPVSFSLPQNQKQVIMQPFVLEDSGQNDLIDVKKTGLKKSFLSSIVFLPVTERLTDPVTVSFKLTPTL